MMPTTEVQWNASAMRFDASTISLFGYSATTIQPIFSTIDFSSQEEHRGLLSTSSAVSDDGYIDIPVVGLNTPLFSIIHSIALSSLAITMFVSISLIIYLCTCGRRLKKPHKLKVPQTLQSTASILSRDNDAVICGPLAEPKANTYRAESTVDSGVHIGDKGKVPKMLPADAR